jgi:hypothetical protein
MLRQESITALSHAPTAPASLECDLHAGTESLIDEIHQRLLAGQLVNNRTLTEMADRAYGGSRARGTYTARDAYDATETAVNKLLETQALALTRPPVALSGQQDFFCSLPEDIRLEARRLGSQHSRGILCDVGHASSTPAVP